jgi:hypothetical protein
MAMLCNYWHKLNISQLLHSTNLDTNLTYTNCYIVTISNLQDLGEKKKKKKKKGKMYSAAT